MALEMSVAVTILRVQEGLDYEGIIGDYDVENSASKKQNAKGVDNPSFTDSPDGSLSSKPFGKNSLFTLATGF